MMKGTTVGSDREGIPMKNAYSNSKVLNQKYFYFWTKQECIDGPDRSVMYRNVTTAVGPISLWDDRDKLLIYSDVSLNSPSCKIRKNKQKKLLLDYRCSSEILWAECQIPTVKQGFPGGALGHEPACQWHEDVGLIPGVWDGPILCWEDSPGGVNR